MSKDFEPGDQMDGCNIICPHCCYAFQAGAEYHDERERTEECGKCGKAFVAWAEIYVTYRTKAK